MAKELESYCKGLLVKKTFGGNPGGGRVWRRLKTGPPIRGRQAARLRRAGQD